MADYLDMSFCGSNCANSGCRRYFSAEHEKRSRELDVSVCWADFSDDCDGYIDSDGNVNIENREKWCES